MFTTAVSTINRERSTADALQSIPPYTGSSHVISSVQKIGEAWNRALADLNIPLHLGDLHLKAILEAYTKPDRHYHNLEHLEDMLRFVFAPGVKLENPVEVIFAILFHDIIYNTHARTTNEDNSALVADHRLTDMGVPAKTIANVKRLIFLSRGHQADPNLPDSKVFLAADLAILSSEPERYLRYAEAIRNEYGWLPSEEYSSGRIRILEKFLPKLSGQAEVNVATEIQRLKQG